jgi:hypothetical protein
MRLAQQAAAAGGEAGVEEPFRQRAERRGLRRRQAVVALDIVLGAQVLEVDPHRRRFGHRIDEVGRRIAAECLDHDVARRHLGQRLDPAVHRYAGRGAFVVRRHPVQRERVIDPQAHCLATRSQIGRQTPADAEVAVVVDDAAKNVPLHTDILTP